MDKRVEDALELMWRHWSEYSGENRDDIIEDLDGAGYAVFGSSGNMSVDPDGSLWFVLPGAPMGGLPVIPEDLSAKQSQRIKALAEATVKAIAAQPKRLFLNKGQPFVKRPAWVHPYHPEGWKIVAEKGPQHPKPQEPLVEDE